MTVSGRMGRRLRLREDRQEDEEAEDELPTTFCAPPGIVSAWLLCVDRQNAKGRTECATSQKTASRTTVKLIVSQATHERRAHQSIGRKKTARTMQATLDCGGRGAWRQGEGCGER